MLNLTEETVKDFIKEGNAVVKVYSDNCPFCTEYEPILDAYAAEHPEYKFGAIKISHPKDPKPQPSEFKRKYLKVKKGEREFGVPVVVVFKDGKMTSRAAGRLFKDQLEHFMQTGQTAQASKPGLPSIEEICRTYPTDKLKVFIFDNEQALKLISHHNDLMYAEINKRQQKEVGRG
jgi:thiol-disulfide isomerase/thioredoxin